MPTSSSTTVGQHVQGSPFLCQVQPGEADAASSRLYGPGLLAIQLGKPSSLFLQLADQWGNAVNAESLAGLGIKVICYTFAKTETCSKMQRCRKTASQNGP